MYYWLKPPQQENKRAAMDSTWAWNAAKQQTQKLWQLQQHIRNRDQSVHNNDINNDININNDISNDINNIIL
jgi:hypothetical protein